MKRHYLILCLFVFAITVSANPVSRQMALQNARAYMNSHGTPVGIVEPAETSKTLKMDKKFGGRLQLFDIENGGFIVASGDDALPAVIGYSMNKMYRCENMPDEIIAFLQKYSDEIKNYQKGGTSVAKLEPHTSVKPMLTTLWGQDNPYNMSCPDFFERGKSITGCAATAMAQLLYFHHNDPHAISALPKDIPAYSGQIEWSDNGAVDVDAVPAGSKIDWQNMLNSYLEQRPVKGQTTATVAPSDVQKKAVADLLFYCAASLKTSFADYHNGGSIASLADIPDALKTYFGYSRGARFIKQSYYKSVAEWDGVVYGELASGRPVLMQGQSKTGGHIFVVDGYADGYYHVNWGWNGGADGYFIMTPLTNAPSKDDMEAVINAMPDDGTFTETPVLVIKQFDIEKSPVEHFDNGYQCDYMIKATSRMANAYTFDIAIGVFNEEGELVKTSSVLSTARDVTSTITATVGGTAALDVHTGTYIIAPVCRVQGTDAWTRCEAASYKMLAESNRASYSK